MKNILLTVFIAITLFIFATSTNLKKESHVSQDGSNKKQVEKEFINPKELADPRGGYTHVVTVNKGKLMYIAGQVPMNNKGEVVGKGDLRAQTTQVYENLKIALAAAGATFADVVKSNIYVVNSKPADVTILREVRSKYINKDAPPVSTFIGVQSLAREEFLIEIEVIAAIGQ